MISFKVHLTDEIAARAKAHERARTAVALTHERRPSVQWLDSNDMPPRSRRSAAFWSDRRGEARRKAALELLLTAATC